MVSPFFVRAVARGGRGGTTPGSASSGYFLSDSDLDVLGNCGLFSRSVRRCVTLVLRSVGRVRRGVRRLGLSLSDLELTEEVLDFLLVVLVGFLHSDESKLESLHVSFKFLDLLFVVHRGRGVSVDFDLDFLKLDSVHFRLFFPEVDRVLKFVDLLVATHIFEFPVRDLLLQLMDFSLEVSDFLTTVTRVREKDGVLLFPVVHLVLEIVGDMLLFLEFIFDAGLLVLEVIVHLFEVFVLVFDVLASVFPLFHLFKLLLKVEDLVVLFFNLNTGFVVLIRNFLVLKSQLLELSFPVI